MNNNFWGGSFWGSQLDSESKEKWHSLLPEVAAGMDDKKILSQLSELAEVDKDDMLA